MAIWYERTMNDLPDDALTRAQRRLLRRIFNERTDPIEVNGQAFIAFRDASRYLLSLPDPERQAAYLEMKRQAG